MSGIIFEELVKSSPFALIELFEVHLVQALHGSNEVYRFFNGAVMQTSSTRDILWKGNAYIAMPVAAEGFEYSGNGQLPRPKLRVANLYATVSAILVSVNDTTPGNDLTGAKVVRIRTLSRFLDPENFDGGVNPYGTPDPNSEMPQEIYYVDRKVTENRDFVEFELAAAFDLAGVRAPKRQCIANLCQWKYRSAECGYTGTNYFDANDKPINSTPATDLPAGSATLNAGSSIFLDQQLVSANRWYRTLLNSDGNLITYDKAGVAWWSTKTAGRGGYRLTMESTGALVLYTATNQEVWSSGTGLSGTATAVTWLEWLPLDTTNGRFASFFHEVLGNADSYPGQSRTASRQFVVGDRTITLEFTATSTALTAQQKQVFPNADYRWQQAAPSPANATVLASTGLWRQGEVFGATVTTSPSNPFRSPVGFGTLVTVTSQYSVASTVARANRAVMQNNGALQLLNSGDALVWSQGVSRADEPRVTTGTGDPLNDVCGKRLSSCKVRFGENAELPFGSFPGVGTFY